MSRVVINGPGNYPFSVEIPVRITDINYGGHLGHDSFMALLHEARVRMLISHGLSEIDIGGCGIIMADTAIVFKSEVFFGATLKVELAVGDMSRSGFRVYYRVTDAGDGHEVAVAETGMVCYDYDRKRPARVPEKFKREFHTNA